MAFLSSIASSLGVRDDSPSLATARTQGKSSPGRWMTTLAPWIADRSFSELAMVGTHDTATYDITSDRGYSLDAPDEITGLPAPVRAAAKGVTSKWAVTQDLTVKQQLEHGVRYMDIRLSTHDGDDGKTLWICHTLYSLPFATVVNDIAEFYKGAGADHKEVLLLDVQSFKGGDTPGPEMHRLFQEAMAPIAHLLVRNCRGIHTKLGDIWAQPGPQRVMVTYCYPPVAPLQTDCYTFRPSIINSHWFNLNKVNQMMEAIDNELNDRTAKVNGDAAGANGHPAHVLQAVMTCETGDIVSAILSPVPGTSRGVIDFADDLNDSAIAAFAAHSGAGRNILMLDFFTRGAGPDGLSAVDHCIAINTNKYASDGAQGTILSAYYSYKDVTDTVRGLVDGSGNLRIGADMNGTFGGDPSPGKAKFLIVDLQDGRRFTYTEGEPASLSNLKSKAEFKHIGTLSDVCSDGPNHIWGVMADQSIYYKPSVTAPWQAVPGKLCQIHVSAGGAHVWGVNEDEEVFHRDGRDGEWEKIPGALVHVACSGLHVWGVNRTNDVYYKHGVHAPWEHVEGKLTQINCSNNGSQVWGVNAADSVYYRSGRDGSWQDVEGRLVHVAAWEQHVWGVNRAGEIFYKYGGTGWKQISGPPLKRIHVSGLGNEVWGITPTGDDVYYRPGL